MMRSITLWGVLLITGCVTTASSSGGKSASPGITIDELEAAPGDTDDTKFEAKYDAAKRLFDACREKGADTVPCQQRVDGARDGYILKSAQARTDPDDAYWVVKFALGDTKPSAEIVAMAKKTSAARAQKKQEQFDAAKSYKNGHNCVFSSTPFSEAGDKNPDLTYSFSGKQPKIYYQCHSDVEFKKLVGRQAKLTLVLRELKTGDVYEMPLGAPADAPGSVMRGEVTFSFSIPNLQATSIYAMINFDSVVGQEVDTSQNPAVVTDKWESQEVAASAFFWDPNAN